MKKEIHLVCNAHIDPVWQWAEAEGHEAIILRILNNSPDKTDTFIKINEDTLPLAFGKYEVKTVLYENGNLRESYELLI